MKVEMVFLLVSNPTNKSIDYVHVVETHMDGKPHGCLGAEGEGFKPLVEGLTSPSYIHYCFEKRKLYICDVDKILVYDIRHGDIGIISQNG